MDRIPSADQILAWLREHPDQTAKRDIARAFGLKGKAKVELKQLLAEMTRNGQIERSENNGVTWSTVGYRPSDGLEDIAFGYALP